MNLNVAQLKKTTLWLIGLIAAGSLSAQQQWLTDHILPLVTAHPHISILVTGLSLVLTAIHNPTKVKSITDAIEGSDNK